MARAWIHDRMEDADYPPKVARARKAKRMPPKRWQVRWYDPNGKQCSELRSKKPEAESLRDQIASALEAGQYRDPKAGREKVRKVAEAWFEGKTPRWTPKTRRLYREVLDGYLLPRWGNTAVSTVDYEGFATWLSGLYNRPGLTGSDKRLVGSARIQTIYQVMRGIMTWAVRSKRIAENPISGLDTLPAIPKPKRLYLDHVQIAALRTAVAKLETHYGKPKPGRELYAVMVDVLAYCGLRIGEAIALRKSSVRLQDLELDVVEAVAEGDDGKPALGLPKGGRIRVVGIPEELVPELEGVLAGLDDEDLVFTSPRDDMLSAANFRDRIFRPAVAEAKLPKGTTPHTLRHSFASLSVAAGADVKTLQAAMGHASATITLDVYADLFPARIGEVASALGKARQRALALAA